MFKHDAISTLHFGGRKHISVFLFCLFSLSLLLSAKSDADTVTLSHGIAMHGDLKYPPSFTHFDYVNPAAPKAGDVTQSALGTFDSFNPFIIKGTDADGLGLVYDTLLSRAQDEPFSLYGLLAKSIELPHDRSWVIFNLNPSARFSDNTPLTAEDVKFTFDTLIEKGKPFYRAYYADIKDIEVLDTYRIRFNFVNNKNQELPLIIGEVPILPKHYWEGRNFEKPSLEIPIGSGPYLIDSFDAGRSMTYRLNPEYWGHDIAVNQGRHNFNKITYDYYRDGTVAMEAFKAGEYDFRLENSSKRWATSYSGPMFEDGRVITQALEHQNPTGMQAFVLNTRRPQFSDPLVRQALTIAFDFEWTNKNIFYNAYKRTHSFFSNSEMAATALPTAEELSILGPIKHQVPKEVFTQVYRAPETDGSGQIYQQLRQAKRLLMKAGWVFKEGKLINAESGEQLSFEMLLVQPAFERVVAPFIRNLERLGINANIRLIDVSQYINRMRQYDFDVIVGSFGQSTSPGNEQRNYWHSEGADIEGDRKSVV